MLSKKLQESFSKSENFEAVYRLNSPVLNITFDSIFELKAKIEAFKTLYDRSPKFSNMIIDSVLWEYATFDAEFNKMYFGYAYSGMVEDCESFIITNNYLIFDNGKKFRPKPNCDAKCEISFY